MRLEGALFVLNLFLCVSIVYSMLQPKPLQRRVRDRIEALHQRWKTHPQLHPKSPAGCALCRGAHPLNGSPRAMPVP
jgi:hypothetical protein